MLYICGIFWLFAHESRDLSQAETKIIIEQTKFLPSKRSGLKKIVILSENSLVN